MENPTGSWVLSWETTGWEDWQNDRLPVICVNNIKPIYRCSPVFSYTPVFSCIPLHYFMQVARLKFLDQQFCGKIPEVSIFLVMPIKGILQCGYRDNEEEGF